jgi:hypothetical protein
MIYEWTQTPHQKRSQFKEQLEILLRQYEYRARHPETYKNYMDFELAKLQIANCFLESKGLPMHLENWDAAHGVGEFTENQFSVYLIANPTAQLFKIGFSRDPVKRRKSFGGGTRLAATGPGGPKREAELHEKFSEHRVGGEWFQLSGSLLDDAISEVKGKSEVVQ